MSSVLLKGSSLFSTIYIITSETTYKFNDILLTGNLLYILFIIEQLKYISLHMQFTPFFLGTIHNLNLV